MQWPLLLFGNPQAGVGQVPRGARLLLIKLFAGEVDEKYSLLTIPLIKAALSGYHVSLDESPDGKQTYAQYLEQGIYLSTSQEGDGKCSGFVPSVSPLQLQLFARRSIRHAEDSVVYILLSLLFFPLFLLFLFSLFIKLQFIY